MRISSAVGQEQISRQTPSLSHCKATRVRDATSTLPLKRVAPPETLFAPVLLQPEQFFTGQRHVFRQTGEHRLLVAVLQNALEHWFRYQHASSSRGRRLFREVSVWFAAENRDWLFAFEHVCDHFGIDPDYIRHGLIQWRTVGREHLAPRFQLTPVTHTRERLSSDNF